MCPDRLRHPRRGGRRPPERLTTPAAPSRPSSRAREPSTSTGPPPRPPRARPRVRPVPPPRPPRARPRLRAVPAPAPCAPPRPSPPPCAAGPPGRPWRDPGDRRRHRARPARRASARTAPGPPARGTRAGTSGPGWGESVRGPARRTTKGPSPEVLPGDGPFRLSSRQAALWCGSLRWRPCGCVDRSSVDAAPPRCFPEPPASPCGRPWVVSVLASDMWEVTP